MTKQERERLIHLRDERAYNTLTSAERSELYRLYAKQEEANAAPDTRGVKTGRTTPQPGEIRGVANEVLSPGQSVSEWRRKALANGANADVRNDGTDRDLNAYWAERCGLKAPSIESRALGEDTTSGAGAGQAIVPQEWSTGFIDLLRAKLVLSQAGMSTMPMATEVYNYPQWTADVAPSWIAENAAVSLDANPSFSTVQFTAKGSYIDTTLVSRMILDDTNQQGGLDGLLREVIAAKYARLVESVAFYGTASNAGNPGLVNESGLVINWNGTNGGAPTDTTPFSVAAESARNANAEPTAFITNPSLRGTFARLNASTFARFWEVPPDVSDLPVLDTTAIVSNETHGTGTNLSSLYAGPWSRMIMGVRTDLDVQVLRERYADQAQIGFVSYMRFSIRTTHPEAFVKQGGYVTT
jgi:HK97 family phage major capsid protein